MSALSSSRRPRAAALALVAVSLTLTSCSTDNDESAVETSPSVTENVAQTAHTAQTASEAAPETTSPETTETRVTETSTTKKSATESSTSTSPTVEAKEAETLKEVREEFASIAPPEFFDKLDGCVPAGIEGSYDCSGSEVGQFQFFASEAKAASTTQLLTELRSSKIVEDNGQRVVGWSTVGTSAIITVVDNTAGLVMQQLISSDQEDPRQRIYDLGLAKTSQ